MDAADALSVDGSNLDVPVVAPSSAPLVSAEVVLSVAFFAVADSSQDVVNLGSTVLRVQDAACIGLELPMISLNGD